MEARTEGLTNGLPVAYPRRVARSARVRLSLVVASAIAIGAHGAHAQDGSDASGPAVPRLSRSTSATATIHWQDVPLGDAVARLEKLFGESIFVDRRIDPTRHVHLDIQATSVEQVLTAIAAAQKFGVSRIGRTAYVGPIESAKQLKTLVRARMEEVNRLPQSERAKFLKRQNFAWPRLSEPRGLVVSAIERAGWRTEGDDRIPHDLWRAGELADLTFAEQLTMLLVGFDLTFELRSEGKLVEIVPLEGSLQLAGTDDSNDEPPPREPIAKKRANTKQVYSLRVVEKPVGPVLRELGRRLNWQLEFDEEAIAAAGRSLDERVSMAVENVDQDALLEALLEPAGLVYEREGNHVKIGPGEVAVD